MSFSDYATYLGVAAVFIGLIAGLDIVFPARIKAKFGNAAQRLLVACGTPFGVWGYLFVLCSSTLLMAAVGALTGVWSRVIEKEEILSLPLKSAGVLIIAIILKILIWDYVLAIKSYLLMKIARAEHAKALRSGAKVGSLPGLLFILLAIDLILSTLVTDLFITTFELSSLQRLVGDSVDLQNQIPPPVRDFFDEVNFSLKHAIERSAYILNGTFVFYFGALLSKFAKKENGVIDWESINDKPFTIFSFALLGVTVVILSSIAIAYK